MRCRFVNSSLLVSGNISVYLGLDAAITARWNVALPGASAP